jgi:hypothetical protein
MKVLLVGEGIHEESGALQAIVERLAGRELDCDFARVQSANIHTHHGKTTGMQKKAIRWMLDARKRGYDAVVFLIDEDGDRNRIYQIECAQENQTSNIGRAVGVAVRTFDAWMLADEKALTSVLCRTVDRPPEPERIRNPKQECGALLLNSSLNLAQRQFYAAIAKLIDLDRLAERCPIGFGPFASRVKKLFSQTA